MYSRPMAGPQPRASPCAAYSTNAEACDGAVRAQPLWVDENGPRGPLRVATIRPESYPARAFRPHHFSAWGGGYPLQWFDELRFTGDVYITPEMFAIDAELSDHHAIPPPVAARWSAALRLQDSPEKPAQFPGLSHLALVAGCHYVNTPFIPLYARYNTKQYEP